MSIFVERNANYSVIIIDGAVREVKTAAKIQDSLNSGSKIQNVTSDINKMS